MHYGLIALILVVVFGGYFVWDYRQIKSVKPEDTTKPSSPSKSAKRK